MLNEEDAESSDSININGNASASYASECLMALGLRFDT